MRDFYSKMQSLMDLEVSNNATILSENGEEPNRTDGVHFLLGQDVVVFNKSNHPVCRVGEFQPC